MLTPPLLGPLTRVVAVGSILFSGSVLLELGSSVIGVSSGVVTGLFTANGGGGGQGAGFPNIPGNPGTAGTVPGGNSLPFNTYLNGTARGQGGAGGL